MNLITKPLLTRNDIALLIGVVTVRQVARNEKRWDLDKARVDLNSRCVCYQRDMAIRILRARRFIE